MVKNVIIKGSLMKGMGDFVATYWVINTQHPNLNFLVYTDEM